MPYFVRRVCFWVALAVLLVPALAQEAAPEATGNPLTLTQALALAPEQDASVLSARSDLDAARRELTRVRADPLALRLDTVSTEQGLANAKAALAAAELAAKAEVQDAYLAALEAGASLEAARLQQRIAETTARATRIRLEAGAATRLDMARAENDLEAAERKVLDAESSRRLALDRLAGLLGLAAEGLSLTQVTEVPVVPDLAAVLDKLPENSALVQARQRVQTAELQLAAVDNAFSSQAQIEQAKSALENAKRQLEDLQRSLELSFRQAYLQVQGSRAGYQNAQAGLATAQETMKAQELRYGAGSISELDLMQARLDLAAAESQRAQALHALLGSLTALQQTVLGQQAGGAP